MQPIPGSNIGRRLAMIRAILKSRLFPTPIDKEIRRWWKEGGDRHFRYNYELDQNSVVLDLGGFRGDWADKIWQQYRCNIHIFEPVKEYYESLKQRFRETSEIVVHGFGLGSGTREEHITLCQDGSSLFREGERRELIVIRDVVEWLSEQSFKKVDLIKINIEGAEYELLERIVESNQVRCFQNIQVQFHNIDKNSHSRMNNIRKSLTSTHQPTYQFEFVWENWQLIPQKML